MKDTIITSLAPVTTISRRMWAAMQRGLDLVVPMPTAMTGDEGADAAATILLSGQVATHDCWGRESAIRVAHAVPCRAVVDGALRAGYANVRLCIVATEPKAKEPHAHH
jgi:hypothetical protein